MTPPVLTTPRLSLRAFRADDADALFAALGDPEVLHWLGTPPCPYTRADAEEFIARRLAATEADEASFAIEAEGELIGSIGWNCPTNAEGVPSPRPHIGYWLARRRWNRGFMTEALRAVCAHLFAEGARDIESGVFEGNIASLKVQEKVGFRVRGQTTRFSRPQNRELTLIETVLTPDAFRDAMS